LPDVRFANTKAKRNSRFAMMFANMSAPDTRRRIFVRGAGLGWPALDKPAFGQLSSPP
jgi:hypothetical protein